MLVDFCFIFFIERGEYLFNVLGRIGAILFCMAVEEIGKKVFALKNTRILREETEKEPNQKNMDRMRILSHLGITGTELIVQIRHFLCGSAVNRILFMI